MMKANFFQIVWVIFASILYTGTAALMSIIRTLLGRSTRPWVDQTLYWFSDKVLSVVNARIQIINPDGVHLEQGKPTIIMCNHTSLYDIPLSFKAFPHASIRMLAKKELSKIPIFGRGMRDAEFIFTEKGRKKETLKSITAMQNLLNSGIVLWIAPEGIRSQNGKLQKFKKGGFITAIETQATIIPIGIRGANKILPAKTLAFGLNQEAEIHIGKPIDASHYDLKNKNILMDLVFESIKKLSAS